jgi:hypothetical protein
MVNNLLIVFVFGFAHIARWAKAGCKKLFFKIKKPLPDDLEKMGNSGQPG